MKTTLSKEEVAQELLVIMKENIISDLPLKHVKVKLNRSEDFLLLGFVDEYSYILSNETIFFSPEDDDYEDDVFLIDCYRKQGFLDIEKYFNITGKETIIEFFCRVYDEVHSIYKFAYGEKHTGVKRPEQIDDILYYTQYDGDNFCFELNAYADHLGHEFTIRMYPIVNLQKRRIEIDYRILSGDFEYNDYEESIADLFESVIFSKIGKNKEDLTLEDSTVLQMLNV